MIKIVNDMGGYSNGIGDKFLVIFSPNLFINFRKGFCKKKDGLYDDGTFRASHSDNSVSATLRRRQREINRTISYRRHLVICYIDYALGTLRIIWT